MTNPDERLERLLESLRHGTRSERMAAQKAFGRLGPEEVEAIPRLVGRLAGDDEARRYLVEAVVRVGTAVLPPLLLAMTDEDYPGWDLAAAILAPFGPLAESAVPTLLLATDGSKHMWSACHTLSEVGRNSVGLIANRLGERPPGRVWILEALGNMGSDATDAVPAIRAILVDPGDSCREGAAMALAKIAPAGTYGDVRGVLRTLLSRDSTLAQKGRAVGIISVLGSVAAEFAPLLRRYIRSGGETLAQISALALVGIVPAEQAHSAALPTLMAMLATEPSIIVGTALGKLGRFAEGAVPRLSRLLFEADPKTLPIWMAIVLLRIGGSGHETLRDAMALSTQERRIALSLGFLLHPELALAFLKTAMTDDREAVRAAARTMAEFSRSKARAGDA